MGFFELTMLEEGRAPRLATPHTRLPLGQSESPLQGWMVAAPECPLCESDAVV
jgi:hypothetical protein